MTHGVAQEDVDDFFPLEARCLSQHDRWNGNTRTVLFAWLVHTQYYVV